VIADSAGNLYGTTYNGGTGSAGVVYKVDPSGQETVLYAFTGGADGANPRGGVIADEAGNLYGTTYVGGSQHAGVVFKLNASGVETVLHTFGQEGQGVTPSSGVILDSDGNLYGAASTVVYRLTPASQYKVLGYLDAYIGCESFAGVVRDAAGNLYGTTGEDPSCTGNPAPYGVVYKVDTAGKVTVLYRFPGPSRPELVAGPNAGLVIDSAGNLYGTSPYGGVSGMVYMVEPSGQKTTLYSFSGAPGGTYPYGGVIRDSAGNLYGTTSAGGAPNEGVLYKVDAAGNETALYTFPDSVGWGLARDSAGNLYGTAGSSATGLGVVFELDSSGQYKVLYSFTGGADGSGSNGVILDTAGNLYGAADGGAANAGLVFKLDPAGDYTVLYSFTGGSDGSQPNYGLILDSEGNLYGTTNEGGLGAGVVYKLAQSGEETVLYSFPGGADGGTPLSGVVRDAAGNIFGTAAGYGELGGGRQGSGVVFELDAAGRYAVLYTFTGGADGGTPYAGVVHDAAGNLYGTTYLGGAGCGSGCGVVYKLDSAGQETVLYTFTGRADGANPEAGVIQDPVGNLYGTTPWGGKGASSAWIRPVRA
jgi:uncharacterized repeat protein (TIGR03803 family)